jgi:hypothetical protein
MADVEKESDEIQIPSNSVQEKDKPEKATAVRREIPGNLPYLTAPGTLKKALDRLIDAQRPERFSVDFLENVLKMSGGSARAVIPVLKKMGFLTGDGVPTELYARFRTEGGRPAAALAGLRNGFPEIFKRSEYAHSADDGKMKDIIVEITGLKPNEPVPIAIRGTFNAIKSYIPAGFDNRAAAAENELEDVTNPPRQLPAPDNFHQPPADLRLAYNINIVLPETSDLAVLNAIFKSIKENLMR